VFNAYMNFFLDVVELHTFQNDHTNRARGNVPHLASFAMVDSVRHAMVNISTNFDIHIISNLVGAEEGRKV